LVGPWLVVPQPPVRRHACRLAEAEATEAEAEAGEAGGSAGATAARCEGSQGCAQTLYGSSCNVFYKVITLYIRSAQPEGERGCVC
jgi:hypothetical protein